VKARESTSFMRLPSSSGGWYGGANNSPQAQGPLTTIDHEYVTKRLEKRLAVMELADEDLERARTLFLGKAESALTKCNALVQELQRRRREIETFVSVSSLWSDAAAVLLVSGGDIDRDGAGSSPAERSRSRLALAGRGGSAATVAGRSPLMESAAMLREKLLAPLEQLMSEHLPPVQRLRQAVIVQTTALAEVKDLMLTCAPHERSAVSQRVREVLAEMATNAEDLLSATWRLDSIWSDVSHKLSHAALRTQASQLRAAARSLDAVAVSMGAPLVPLPRDASGGSLAAIVDAAGVGLGVDDADAGAVGGALIGAALSTLTPTTPMRRTPRLRGSGGGTEAGVPAAIRNWNAGHDGAVSASSGALPATPQASARASASVRAAQATPRGAQTRTPEPPLGAISALLAGKKSGASHGGAEVRDLVPAEAIQLWMRVIGAPLARRRGSSEGGSNGGAEDEWESAAAHTLRRRRAQWHGIGTGRSAAQGGVTSGVSVHSIAALQHESTAHGHVRCPSTFLLTVSGDLLVSSDATATGEEEAAAAPAPEEEEAEAGSAAAERALTSVHAMLLLRALSPQRRHIVAVAAGRAHVALLTCSCEVWTWGDGRRGQLGHGRPGDTASGLADGVAVWLPTFFPPIPPSPAHERAPRLVTALLGKVCQIYSFVCYYCFVCSLFFCSLTLFRVLNSPSRAYHAAKRTRWQRPRAVPCSCGGPTRMGSSGWGRRSGGTGTRQRGWRRCTSPSAQCAPVQRSAPPSPPISSGYGASSATDTCCLCRAMLLSRRSAASASSRAAARSSSSSAAMDRRCTRWGFAASRVV
jgi:hypothetical protein